MAWAAWDNDPGAGFSEVTEDPGDAGQVVSVGGPDDLVKHYTGLGLDTGRWQMSGDLYIPLDYEGSAYFILLNTYTSSADANWSTQVQFDSNGDQVVSDFDDGEQNEVTFTRGAWKEVRVVIDLDDESSETGQRIYYDDRLIVEKSWVDGVSGGGQSRLEAMDLFGNDATPVYWDNFRICRLLDCPGDLDADEAIGLSDLVLLLDAWGDEGGPADIDGSGRVDFDDLLIVLDGWGPCD